MSDQYLDLDLVSFDTPKAFRAFLKAAGLKDANKTRKDGEPFRYTSPGVVVECNNDPISGIHYIAGYRAPEKGYASYVCIHASEAVQTRIAALVRAHAPYIKSIDG